MEPRLSRERLRSIVMSMSVCRYVCPSVRISPNHTHDFYQIFVHFACVRGSVLLRHVYDRQHGLSLGRDFLPHWKCVTGRERGWECTARAKYMLPVSAIALLVLFTSDAIEHRCDQRRIQHSGTSKERKWNEEYLYSATSVCHTNRSCSARAKRTLIWRKVRAL